MYEHSCPCACRSTKRVDGCSSPCSGVRGGQCACREPVVVHVPACLYRIGGGRCTAGQRCIPKLHCSRWSWLLINVLELLHCACTESCDVQVPELSIRLQSVLVPIKACFFLMIAGIATASVRARGAQLEVLACDVDALCLGCWGRAACAAGLAGESSIFLINGNFYDSCNCGNRCSGSQQ